MVVSSALAGAATALAAWTALDVGRALKHREVLRAKEAEFVEFAETIELRVEHAEQELEAALKDVRRDAVSAVRTLREQLEELERAFAEHFATHRGVGEDRPSRPMRPTRLDEHVDEVLGAAAGGGESATTGRSERPLAGAPGWPVAEIPGIDEAHVLRLHAAGIHDTVQLCAADPVDVAKRVRVWPNLVRNWQVTAEMLPRVQAAQAAAGPAG